MTSTMRKGCVVAVLLALTATVLTADDEWPSAFSPITGSDVYDAVFPAGSSVVVTRSAGGITAWDLQTLEPQWHEADVTSVLHDVRVSGVVGVNRGETVLHIDAETGRELRRIPLPWSGKLYAHPDGTWGIVRERRRYRGALWGDTPPGVTRLFDQFAHFGSAVFSADGEILYASGHDGTVVAWDITAGRARWVRSLDGRLRSQFYDFRALRLQEPDEILIVRLTAESGLDVVLDTRTGAVVTDSRFPRIYQAYPEHNSEVRGESGEPAQLLHTETGESRALIPIMDPPYNPPIYRVNPAVDHYASVDAYGQFSLRRLSDGTSRTLPWQRRVRLSFVTVTPSGDVVLRSESRSRTRGDRNGAFLLSGVLRDGEGTLPAAVPAQFEYYLYQSGTFLVSDDAGRLQRLDGTTGGALWTSDSLPPLSVSSLSPDQRYLVIIGQDDAYGVDLDNGRVTVYHDGAPDFLNVGRFRWSPDGTRVVGTVSMAAMGDVFYSFPVYDLESGTYHLHETEWVNHNQEDATLVSRADWVDEYTILLYTDETPMSREHFELWRFSEGDPQPVDRGAARRLFGASDDRSFASYRVDDGYLSRYHHGSGRVERVMPLRPHANFPSVTHTRNHVVFRYSGNEFQIAEIGNPDSGTVLFLWDHDTWASWDREGLVAVTPEAEAFLLRTGDE